MKVIPTRYVKGLEDQHYELENSIYKLKTLKLLATNDTTETPILRTGLNIV